VLRVTAAVDTVVWLVLLQHYPTDAPTNENVAAPSLKLALHTFKGNRKAYNMADDHLKCPWKVSYTPRYASLRLTCPRGEQVQFLKSQLAGTGWRRLIGCFELQVVLRKRATIYWALLRKVTYKDR